MDVRKKLAELIREISHDKKLYLYDLCDMFEGSEKIADLLIENGVTVQEWVSVEDRLPESKGQYIVAYHPCYWNNVQENTICVGMDSFMGKTRWAKNKFQRVTHWMPLLEPPKGE